MICTNDGVKMHKIAIYPGTFDPVTNGHVDIIKRASTLFDEIIVAVADSKKKNPLFDIKQRLAMVEEATKDLHNVKVASFNMLLVEFVKRNNANIIIRGLRAVSDFEYEIQLGYANSSLDSSIETVYLMPTLEQAFVSSSIVRSILEFNGPVEHLVPKAILSMLKRN